MSKNKNNNRNERRFSSVTRRFSSIFPGLLKVNRGFNLEQDEETDIVTALPSVNSQYDSSNVATHRRRSLDRTQSVILPQFRSPSLYDIFQYSSSSIDLSNCSLNEKDKVKDITNNNNNISFTKDRSVEKEEEAHFDSPKLRPRLSSAPHRTRTLSLISSIHNPIEEPTDQPVLRHPDRLIPPTEIFRNSAIEIQGSDTDLTYLTLSTTRQFRSQSLCNLVSIPDAKDVGETSTSGLSRHSNSLRGRGGTSNMPNTSQSSLGEASGDAQPQNFETSRDQSLKVPGGETSGPDTVDRRQAFSRSQVSSSEFFSVSFVGGDISDSMRTEFVPSGKEMLMAEALCGALQIRNLDNQHIECYIENSSVILPFLCTETSWLGGKHIICLVNPKDGKKGTDKQSRLVKSTSTSSQYSSRKLSKLEASTMENLSKILDSFSHYGVPKVPELTSCDLPEENMYLLETSWRDIVRNHEIMSENDIRLQESMWELVVTENKHIQHLKLMTDLFQASLVHLQAENILVEVNRNLLYSNVAELFDLHRYFWNDLFVELLHRPRLSGERMDPQVIIKGFSDFRERFISYVKYCTDQQEHCRHYCKKLMKDEFFKVYCVWCETHMENNRLGILDLFIIPLQRLTKYALLLKEIKKYLPADSVTAAQMDITAMNVHMFVESINTSLQLLMDEALLKELAPRIDNYETPDYKKEDEFERLNRPYASIDLLGPMPGCSPRYLRKILQEGAITIREQWKTKAVEAYAFLFTDMLLICKKKSSERYKVIRQPYCIDRLVITEVMRENTPVIHVVYLDMFNIPVKSFIFASFDKSILIKSWVKNMEKAQIFFQQARILSANGAVIRLMHEQGLPVDLIPPDRSEKEGIFYASQFMPYCNHKQFEGKDEYSSSQCSQLPSLLHSHRGVSYPPPSPRALRRSYAVPQSRNPPLLKSRHVLGVRSANEVESFDVPVLPTAGSQTKDSNVAATVTRQTSGVAPPVPPRQMSYSDESTGGGKRLVRQDPRRYYTAGVVDDIKKQETKDATLQKRLSLNAPIRAIPLPTPPPIPPKTGIIAKTMPHVYVDHVAINKSVCNYNIVMPTTVPGIVQTYDSETCREISRKYAERFDVPHQNDASAEGEQIVQNLNAQVEQQEGIDQRDDGEGPIYESFQFGQQMQIFGVNILDPKTQFKVEDTTSTISIDGTSGTSDA